MHTGESVLGEADRSLIHALQIAPRASWTHLSAVLGASPDTLARRWEHLNTDGYAWNSLLTARLGHDATLHAWVELECVPGDAEAIALQVAGDPCTLGVHQVTGEADLVLLVVSPDLHALDAYLTERIRRLPGVIRSRTRVVTRLHNRPYRSRLEQLPPGQAHPLAEAATSDRKPRAAAHARAYPYVTDLDRRLVAELAGDARRSAAELARQCDTSESTVRRRLETLTTAGVLHHHCQAAPRFSGRPVWAMVTADVQPLDVPATVAALTRLRQTLLVTSVTGRHNLSLAMWLRTVDELHAVTAAMVRAAPGLRITGTSLSLRTHKIGAQVLGADGRRTHHVAPLRP
ncbi:Lrp/AsnC family transcriptional regulator [Streptomyces sp. NPDC059534]|uniref:Lrp/AsnC family transcriptional regulator n=1 Tax=Streptomyces sp. NPDC059534 TaxID=3346859 RepID=UPI003694A4AC